MKAAILADIHGNSVALNKVLEDIQSIDGVDEYWFLGDYAAIGHDPTGVLERISNLPNARFFRQVLVGGRVVSPFTLYAGTTRSIDALDFFNGDQGIHCAAGDERLEGSSTKPMHRRFVAAVHGWKMRRPKGGAHQSSPGSRTDFTMLGDNVNVTARPASKAGTGEVLIIKATYAASGLDLSEAEYRQLELKDKSEPIGVHVLRVP